MHERTPFWPDPIQADHVLDRFLGMVLMDLDTNISSERVRSSRFRACLRANLYFLISLFSVTSLLFLSFLSFLLSMGTFSPVLYFISLFLGITCVQSTTLPAPGQPAPQATVGGFVIIGSSYVSAQQVRLLSIIHNSAVHAKFLFFGSCSSGHPKRFTS